MGLGNLFKSKKKKVQEQRLKEYEAKKILQVDKDIDNKRYIENVDKLEVRNANGVSVS